MPASRDRDGWREREREGDLGGTDRDVQGQREVP